jgi:hypothetical protein
MWGLRSVLGKVGAAAAVTGLSVIAPVFARTASATAYPNSCPNGGNAGSTQCFNPNDGTAMTGAYGTWHDNKTVIAGSNAQNLWHVNEEMWGYVTQNEKTGGFIEGGLRNGYLPEDPCQCVAYAVFWAETSSAQVEYRHYVTNLSPDGLSHNYEFERSGCGCSFNFYYDYNYEGSATHLDSGTIYDHQMGLEDTTVNNDSEADTFDLFAQYRNSADTWIYWPSSFAFVNDPCGIDPNGYCLNGQTVSSYEWRNNKPL